MAANIHATISQPQVSNLRKDFQILGVIELEKKTYREVETLPDQCSRLRF